MEDLCDLVTVRLEQKTRVPLIFFNGKAVFCVRHAMSDDSVCMPEHDLTFNVVWLLEKPATGRMVFHGQLSQETCRVLVQENFPDHEDLIVPALNEPYLRRGLGQMQRGETFCLVLLSVQRPETQEEEWESCYFVQNHFFVGTFSCPTKTDRAGAWESRSVWNGTLKNRQACRKRRKKG